MLAEENMRKSYRKTPEAEEMCRKILGRDWVDTEIPPNCKKTVDTEPNV
jgi:hypothetical protein